MTNRHGGSFTYRAGTARPSSRHRASVLAVGLAVVVAALLLSIAVSGLLAAFTASVEARTQIDPPTGERRP